MSGREEFIEALHSDINDVAAMPVDSVEGLRTLALYDAAVAEVDQLTKARDMVVEEREAWKANALAARATITRLKTDLYRTEETSANQHDTIARLEGERLTPATNVELEKLNTLRRVMEERDELKRRLRAFDGVSGDIEYIALYAKSSATSYQDPPQGKLDIELLAMANRILAVLDKPAPARVESGCVDPLPAPTCDHQFEMFEQPYCVKCGEHQSTP